MSDLISREALCEYALNQKDKSITLNDIMRFPSAQPEERTEERTETHACDCISRQAVIDAVETIGFDFSDSDLSAVELEEVCEAIGEVRQEWLQRIKRLSSAQPEIVRCKDCKQFRRWIDTDISFCDITEAEMSDNDFCSKAERITDE